MRKPIDGTRVKVLREQKKLSQAELAKKARISVDSLSRIECGRQSGKAGKTVENLSRALGVSEDVLRGDAPMPETSEAEPTGLRRQLNVRVSDAVRNAFALAAIRYGIPANQIVELAPFLFVVAAEQSLRRRSERVAEMQSAIDRAWEVGESSRSYLLRNTAYELLGETVHLEVERTSIASRDILAEETLSDVFLSRSEEVDADFDEARDNPFVDTLRELAARSDAAEIERFWPGDIEYRVCRDEAVAFAGGNENVAEMILNGTIALHDIPSELRRDDAADRRKVWLQEMAAKFVHVTPDMV